MIPKEAFLTSTPTQKMIRIIKNQKTRRYDTQRVPQQMALKNETDQATTNQSINRSDNPTIKQSSDRSINQSIEQSMKNRWRNRSINQSIDSKISQSINQSMEEPFDQSINRSVANGKLKSPVRTCTSAAFRYTGWIRRSTATSGSAFAC